MSDWFIGDTRVSTPAILHDCAAHINLMAQVLCVAPCTRQMEHLVVTMKTEGRRQAGAYHFCSMVTCHARDDEDAIMNGLLCAVLEGIEGCHLTHDGPYREVGFHANLGCDFGVQQSMTGRSIDHRPSTLTTYMHEK